MSPPTEPLAPVAPSVSIDIPKEYNFGPTVLQPPLKPLAKLANRGFEVESLVNTVDTSGPSHSNSKGPPPPPLDALETFKGCFRGFGFNTIFRPGSRRTPTIFDKEPTDTNDDNVLQLNLTSETQTFGNSLGDIPNRGLFDQADINLTGFPYTQTIIDAMPPTEGDNAEPPIIHFEPGLWMRVPKVEHMPELSASFCRMGSIPHGTTINAQGFSSSITSQGAPDIPSIDITPILIPTQGGIAITGADRVRFNSQTAEDTASRRLPQDLSPFVANGTITQDILNNPNTILVDANRGKTIIENTMFIVSTKAPPHAFGGGTSNIGFNVGADGGQGAASNQNNSGNANAMDVIAQYWVSQVRAEVKLDPSMKVGQKVSPAALHQRDTVPEFFLDEGITIPSSPTTVTVVYPQIQYSQLVYLDFNGLKWPHVTVATLAPIVQNEKPTLSSVIEKKSSA
ncbi:hypothetical protein FPOA_00108 [Fusarium poae]|uniref:Uncharacterized protein n=1 Tax=Fusarium poae TaxID=36050 RepID=A0A1B8B0F6_FUSPO|nr:hypothetical protein FPOA_00108 [Fusarium poae]